MKNIHVLPKNVLNQLGVDHYGKTPTQIKIAEFLINNKTNMGCHTWYRKPLVKGKENVQKYLREKIDTMRKKDWWGNECEQEAILSLKAIDALDEKMDEELLEVVCLNDTLIFINGEPQIFVDANEFDTDEPRIGGYPDTIIKSADEMFKAMETGLVNWEEKHFNFYWDKDREEYIRKNIVDFFNAHPDGIIEFG